MLNNLNKLKLLRTLSCTYLIWLQNGRDVYVVGLLETTVPSTSSIISLYSLFKDGDPCIFLRADASITFAYKTKSGDDKVSLIDVSTSYISVV
jgi:hypothetical protein